MKGLKSPDLKMNLTHNVQWLAYSYIKPGVTKHLPFALSVKMCGRNGLG
jgi:hypothetical protein